MSNKKELKLLNPIEMYYPDYFKNLPSEEEQHALLVRYRTLIKNSISYEDKEIEETDRSFKILNEILEKRDYFENVRNIMNQLLSNKHPGQLFVSMFPSNRTQSEIYRSQFTDACDLLLNKDKVDWERMNLPWYNFKNEFGGAVNDLNYELKINWNIDYWTQEAKSSLFKFWRERYSKIAIIMSPAKNPAGGVGFFDAENVASKSTSYKFVFNKNHKVNMEYERRTANLKKEQVISQDVDKYRLHLLLEAERLCWTMWKDKNLFLIKEGDSIGYITRVKRKNEQNEIAFKEALGLLIEYDKNMGLPITDPDRDLKGAEPINAAEYRKWLTRSGRVVEEDSDEDIYLKNLFKKNKDVQVKPINPSFIPMFLEEYVKDQIKTDKQNNIIRNKSGLIVSIDGEHQRQEEKTFNIDLGKDLNGLERIKLTQDNLLNQSKSNTDQIQVKVLSEPENLNIPEKEKFNSQSDLKEQFSDVLGKISDVTKEKEIIEKKGYMLIDSNNSKKIPKGHPYANIFNELEEVEDTDGEIKEAINIKLEENRDLSKNEVEDIYNKNDHENDLIFDSYLTEEAKKEEEKSEEETGKSGSIIDESGEESIWIEEEAPVSDIDKNKLNSRRSKYLERKKNIQKKTIKVFDRNKQVEKMQSEWKTFPPVKNEGSFIEVAQDAISSFKEGAKSLWKNRIKFNIKGNELNKISIVKRISERFNKERKQKYDSIEDHSIAIYETEIKPTKNRLKM